MFANDNVCVETELYFITQDLSLVFANDNVCVETQQHLALAKTIYCLLMTMFVLKLSCVPCKEHSVSVC
ncbi:Uncharacterised protein [Campylobacter fetus subsp. fetus]|nr:Uncharacterised protein [Campylobacter fetus subsp. fetus]